MPRTKEPGVSAGVPKGGPQSLPEKGPVTKAQEDLGLIIAFSPKIRWQEVCSLQGQVQDQDQISREAHGEGGMRTA